MVGAKVKPAAAPAAAIVVWVPMAQPMTTSSAVRGEVHRNGDALTGQAGLPGDGRRRGRRHRRGDGAVAAISARVIRGSSVGALKSSTRSNSSTVSTASGPPSMPVWAKDQAVPSGPAGWPSVVLMKMDQNPMLGSAGATPLMLARNPVVGAKVKPAAAPAAAMVVWVPMAQPISTSSVPGAKSTATVTPVPGAQACPVTVAGGAAAAGVAPVSSVVATSSRPAATVASIRRWSGTWRFFTGTFFARGTSATPIDHQDIRHRAVHRRFR